MFWCTCGGRPSQFPDAQLHTAAGAYLCVCALLLFSWYLMFSLCRVNHGPQGKEMFPPSLYPMLLSCVGQVYNRAQHALNLPNTRHHNIAIPFPQLYTVETTWRVHCIGSGSDGEPTQLDRLLSSLCFNVT